MTQLKLVSDGLVLSQVYSGPGRRVTVLLAAWRAAASAVGPGPSASVKMRTLAPAVSLIAPTLVTPPLTGASEAENPLISFWFESTAVARHWISPLTVGTADR